MEPLKINSILADWPEKHENTIFEAIIRGSKHLLQSNADKVTILLCKIEDELLSFECILNRSDIKRSLKKALDFFIHLEAFEKCAEIKSILDSLPKNFNKTLTNI